MSLNVLVVDDSAVMRTMLIRTLKLSEVPLARVHQAGHGGEALEVLQQEWVDLALIDLNMPVMDGEALIEAIRGHALYGDLPIVVVSTEGSAARIERIRPLITAFVRKPFTPERIRAVVRDIIGDINGGSGGSDALGPATGGHHDF